MKCEIIKGVIAFWLLAARMASAQGTTTFLSDIGQASTGSLAVGSDSWVAAGFVTGTNSSGYVLDSIQLGMANSTGSPSDFTVMLFANGNPGGFTPGNSLATFIGSLDPSVNGTYTAPVGIMLSTRDAYFIVVTAGVSEATGAYQWSLASANSYNTMDGFFSLGGTWTSSDGSSWTGMSGFLQYSVIGSMAPEPGVMVLLVVGGGLIFLKFKVRSSKFKGCKVCADETSRC